MNKVTPFFLLLIFLLVRADDICTIIESNGYPCELHTTTTSDGFILSVYRIPYSAASNSTGNKPAVFLQHGLLDCAAAWVVNSPSESLGYILADHGFDVYLGNIRGNTYSSNNTQYSPSDPAYWDLIDFDNMIAIDLPAQIDLALAISGQKNLVYIGHSQGTLMGFGGFSSQPQTAAKVSIFIAMAPVAYVNHQTSILLTALSDLDTVLIFELFGIEDFLPSNEWLKIIGGILCLDIPMACSDFLFLLCGWDTTNLNSTRIPYYLDYTPAGTSVRNMAHWSQMVNSGKFQMYDYGRAGNIEHYNQATPPQYYLSNLVNPPVALFTGTNDDLADPQDVQELIANLPNNNKPVLVNNQVTYEHLDFTWGVNAHKLIYPSVVQLAQKYSGQV